MLNVLDNSLRCRREKKSFASAVALSFNHKAPQNYLAFDRGAQFIKKMVIHICEEGRCSLTLTVYWLVSETNVSQKLKLSFSPQDIIKIIIVQRNISTIRSMSEMKKKKHS